jgi:phosphocarrier protein HPr
MIERRVTITNKMGLHLRAAADLVKTASGFESDVVICRDNVEVNAKSIMSVLGLEAAKGVEVVVRAQGADEERALKAVIDLIEAKFNEGE